MTTVFPQGATPLLDASLAASFTPPNFDASYVDSRWQTILPVNGLGTAESQQGATVSFHIPACRGSQLMDLSQTLVVAKLQVVNKKFIKPATSLDTSTVNLPLHSLIKEVSIYANDVPIYHTSNYHYLAYYFYNRHFNNDVKNSLYKMAGFFQDSPDHFDVGTDPNNDNTGYRARKNLFAKCTAKEKEGKKVYPTAEWFDYTNLMGPFAIPLKFTLPPGVSLNIQIKLQKPELFFLSKATTDQPHYKLHLFQLRVLIREMETDLFQKYLTTLQAKPLIYKFDRMQLNVFPISLKSAQFVTDNVLLGKNPVFISIAFVKQEAFNGKLELNPYNFLSKIGEASIKKVSVLLDGQSVDGLDLGSNDGGHVLPYFKFFALNGQLMSNAHCSNLTGADFLGGSFFNDFDLTARQNPKQLFLSPSMNVAVPKVGLIRVIVDFSKTPEIETNMLVFIRCPSQMTVDHKYDP